jgi:sugar/nucleoside kinase (ribokinase family)
VGDDALGRAIIDILRTNGPGMNAEMVVAADQATSYSIVISPPGVDRSFLHCPGANDSFTADDVGSDQLSRARLFHFGYPPIMRAMYRDGGVELERLFERVRAAGVVTSLDMAQPDIASEAGKVDWDSLLRRVLPLVDAFTPSIEELLFMLERPAFMRLVAGEAQTRVIDGPLIRHLGERLVQMGATLALIKLGDRGVYLRTSAEPTRIDDFCRRLDVSAAAWRNREIHSPCFRANRVVGTTGSGDCTIAGFLAALLRGDDPFDAATAATAVGACNVEAADATSGVPSWSVVQKRLAAGWPRLPADIDWGSEVTAQPQNNGTISLYKR